MLKTNKPDSCRLSNGKFELTGDSIVDSAVKFLRILEINRVVHVDKLVGVLATKIVSTIIRLRFELLIAFFSRFV